MTETAVDQFPQGQARSGYTLPVFACAAAIAALRYLRGERALATVALDLLNPDRQVEIPVEPGALIGSGQALGVTRSDPGDNLDLTRHTPIWARVEWGGDDQTEPIALLGGEGIGQITASGDPAIYGYARALFAHNLTKHLKPGEKLRITVILPEGRSLAARTSNAAFGVVEGLSLLGTSGLSAPLSAPGQLEAFRADLQSKVAQQDLVFCIGENGLDLAARMGINPDRLVKTANWMGPLLVEAGIQGVRSILLFGYHGKLIKLAGGIFHTHHHVADGRQEILTAYAAAVGVQETTLQTLLTAATAEAGLQVLRSVGQSDRVYQTIAERIDQRSAEYIQIHAERSVEVGTLLFDRDRQILVQSKNALALLESRLRL
ncbi:MAG: cobalt-precorrin-5B (C(1))-methyltransferase [Alkalinema sp. RU_4_3]|nr:cobalt-precorrin-5B (C(1))-methyltransferase [Alkalinema sp. RU_4_3]